jgi:hypothetical protein
MGHMKVMGMWQMKAMTAMTLGTSNSYRRRPRFDRERLVPTHSGLAARLSDSLVPLSVALVTFGVKTGLNRPGLP